MTWSASASDLPEGGYRPRASYPDRPEGNAPADRQRPEEDVPADRREVGVGPWPGGEAAWPDRKSTRLNSSHLR